MKQKITEIPISKKITDQRTGSNGELIREEKEINVFREVEVVTGWKRFGHYLIDTFCYYIFTYLIGLAIGIILGISGTTLYLDETEIKIVDYLLGALILHPLFYTIGNISFKKHLENGLRNAEWLMNMGRALPLNKFWGDHMPVQFRLKLFPVSTKEAGTIR